jgi:signal transduction histidine kinase/CheY-like chemotaxis protein
MLEQSNHLLSETRSHRGELSKALKNITLANELQRRTEKELIVARKGAEEARIMKEKFAAKVSHELRTPLALIAGFSEVMYASPEIYGDVTWTPTMRRDISQIYQNSHHLLAMVDDILNLSRFEMTGFTISLEDVKLGDLLEETASIARDLFRSEAVVFWMEKSPDLPIVHIDRTRIRQVILNLINNARRFTEKGEVCLSAQVNENEVLICVRDTGPGIAQEQLGLIFEEFYQVEDRLLKNKGGTGLGLAICKNFVETHGGHIWVESELGKGSCFYFSLPFNRAFVSAAVDWNKEGAVMMPRILVYGADEHVLAMLRSTLVGYDVLQVDRLEHLQALVALYHPRAVVSNTLPGDETVTDLDAAQLSVPLIRCSLPSTLWLVKKYDIQACLSKPLSHDILVRELDRLPEIKTVLLVDDDEDFTQLLLRILQTINQELVVTAAGDGRTGLAQLGTSKPDLVILDLNLPDMDGFGLIQTMKMNPDWQEIPVILITATLTPERLLAFPATRILVERKGEMQTIESLKLIKAALDVLDSQYDDTTDEVIEKITDSSSNIA